MFQKMQAIDEAFKRVRLFAACAVLFCAVVSLFAINRFARALEKANSSLYVLADGKVLEAYRSERRDNLPVEARDHVRAFHEYFFTLSPDDQVILRNMRSALYLADLSAKREYDRLQEQGYFRDLVAGNVNQEIRVDSVSVNMDKYPYYFKCYAMETITRLTSITTRSLVTEGYLRDVSRSDNDPHGFLIERWVILENKDLNTVNRP
jgi:conjugative transposon TraK protein